MCCKLKYQGNSVRRADFFIFALIVGISEIESLGILIFKAYLSINKEMA